MSTSEKTDKIDAALGRVQAELSMAKRNKEVEVEGKTSRFASKFVTIAALYEVCRELLTREHITIWQGGRFEANGGGERLITRLSHEDQWIESSFPVKAREGAQNFGGGVAFARRWGLACAVGIFPADDSDERHGYTVAGAETKASKRSPAPANIGAALEAIGKANAERLADIAPRIRGDFPTGEGAKAVEDAITAWAVDAFTRVERAEDLLALRVACREKIKPRGNDAREALAAAERRTKGAAS